MRYELGVDYDELRAHDAYLATCKALTGDSSPEVLLQFEILVAACGVVAGGPVIAGVTKQHLAIFLAVAECTHAASSLVLARLSHFAKQFNCSNFKEFRERREEYSGQLGGGPSGSRVLPPTPADPRESESIPYRLGQFIGRGFRSGIGWGVAIPLLFLVLAGIIAINHEVPRGPSEPVTQTFKPETSTPRIKARDEWARFFPDAGTTNLKPVIPRAPTIDDISDPVLESPPNGATRVLSNAGCVAPFEIRAARESDSLVKLRDYYTNADVMTIFVRRGQTANVDVPLGTFKVRWTSGIYWLGDELRFGNSECWEAKDTFHFQIDTRNNQINGYTITLYEVPRGNLDKRKISTANF